MSKIVRLFDQDHTAAATTFEPWGKVTVRAASDTEVKWHALRVLIAMSSFAGKDGSLYASLQAIAARAG